MTNAEKSALEFYPPKLSKITYSTAKLPENKNIDYNKYKREIFIEGYNQGKKLPLEWIKENIKKYNIIDEQFIKDLNNFINYE